MKATILIQSVFKVAGNVVPMGIVKEGILKVGMKSSIGKSIVTVKAIEMNRAKVQQATAGNMVLIFLDGDVLMKYVGQEITFFEEKTAPAPTKTL
jgi:GTPase